MPLEPGTRLGPYEVVVAIGAGGMGEVYRARDTRLKRDVALKILPDSFANDPERLARFQREAEVLASLNHPHIAGIHGLEESGDVHALVMELVEGPTLADRIADGAIPLDEALPIAKQIAEALEAAHEQGIIHRDLKPANIKVRPDGTVKVLDFGLAKALEPSGSSRNVSQSPTITTPAMTQAGMILGTAAYMSPEQTRGKAVDRRADIWAFGAVLFEMLTGARAFVGDDVSDVMASVLAREPDWGRLPAALSPVLGIYIRRCLHKDPKQRIHDIGDVRLAMEGAFETVRIADTPLGDARVSSWRILSAVMAVILVGAITAGAAWMLKPVEPRAVMRFSHQLGDETFSRLGRHVVAISRDGRRLAYVADNRIYLRNLDESSARPIPGTDEDPSSPFFSPDGEWVGFWSSAQELKKIRLAGGTPATLTKAGNPLGVSWGPDDRIVYALTDGVWRVSANGGVAEQIIKAATGERIHAPQMLPGGNAVLFTVTTATGSEGWDKGSIVAQRLDTGARTVLHVGGADPRYVPTGHLVYALGNSLFALAFDPDALTVRGGPVPIVPEVRRAVNFGIAQYAISDDGTLVYVSGGSNAQMTLSLADRSGALRPLPGSSSVFANHPRFNHDDSRIAVHRAADGVSDIWIYEVPQSQWRQLTFAGGDLPVWTPDGRAITYRNGGSLWQIPSDFSGVAERLPGTDVPGNAGPFAWSPNGEVLLYGSTEGLRAYRAKGRSKEAAPSETLLLKPPEGSSLITRASFSPDGRWFVHAAIEPSGSYVYVSPFPFGPGGHRKILNASAYEPVWSRNGREIFLLGQGGTLQVLGIKTEPTPDWTNPETLFTVRGLVASTGGPTNYDVSQDGQRFLQIVPAVTGTSDTTSEIHIVVNWHEELKRLVPSN